MTETDQNLYDPIAYTALLSLISERRNKGGVSVTDLDEIHSKVSDFTHGMIDDPTRIERELRRYLFTIAIDAHQVARAAQFVEMACPPDLRNPPRHDLAAASGDERVRWFTALGWVQEAQGRLDEARDTFAVAGEEYARLPNPELGRFATLTNAVQSAYELGDFRRGERLLRRTEDLAATAVKSTSVPYNLALARMFPLVPAGDVAGFGAALEQARAACLAHQPSQLEAINRFAALQFLRMGAPAQAEAALAPAPGATSPVGEQCEDGLVRLQVEMALGAPNPALTAHLLKLYATPESAPHEWALCGVLAQALFALHHTEAAVVMSTIFVRGIETVTATLPQRRSEAPELRARILAVFTPMIAALSAANYPRAAEELTALHQALLQGQALRKGAYEAWAPGAEIAQGVEGALAVQAKERVGAVPQGAFAAQIMAFGATIKTKQENAVSGGLAQTTAGLRISFIPVNGQLLRHVATAQGTRQAPVAMSLVEISAQMRALRHAFESDDEGLPPREALGTALLAGLEGDLAGVEQVHILPFGPVATLPFGALLLHGQVLTARATLTIGTGVSSPCRTELGTRQIAIEVAYAQGSEQDHIDAPRLEAEEIALLHGAPTATLQEFNRASLQRAVHSRPKILHIAAHFRMKEGDLGGSSLIGARGEEIPITEVFNTSVDLTATELVFLAGCDSAGHGGTQSLAGQLNALGAQHVIAALWPVDDAATRAFAVATHRAVARGLSPELALAQAVQTLQHQPVFAAPRHWAAFQCYRA